ncbi:MAG: symmetrical bis(5'-nucleosyl)-tetraphosphatase [Wenzhouxiangella sp.]|jgi:bis(5'-nucleosyl)-tetraphosphatase (symmetrical)|nr:symmetrical bis(5'-nucleosyl)-tetraphosphatase [Wenzhouxiangella sp.]
MKRQIFIGDVQGCRDALARLLDRLDFDPSKDRLRFAGDLVNRGGQSLETLRLVRSCGDAAMTVLGNHDLHLLAYAHGHAPARLRRNAEFEEILNAPDGPDLLAWLRGQPLFWTSAKKGLALVHAGTDPRWGPRQTAVQAAELEHALVTEPDQFFRHMYGDRPRRWRPGQPHYKRLRASTNVLTRMRFCDASGRLDLEAKSDPRLVPKGCRPWFEHLHPDWRGRLLIFGHWAMLGLMITERVACLDSGCVWGGRLTALVDDGDTRSVVSVEGQSRRRMA